MQFLLSLFSGLPYLLWPQGGMAWAGLLALSVLLALVVYRWREMHVMPWRGRETAIALGLGLLAWLLSGVLGVRLPAWGLLPTPGLPMPPQGPLVMLFASLPWLLAGGLLGVMPAAGVAAVSGLVFALWETHSPFTVVSWGMLGALGGFFLQQPYRTRFYRLARHPLAQPVLLAGPYAALFLTVNMLTLAAGTLQRLEFSLTRLGLETLAWVLMALMGGLLAEMVYLLTPSWYRRPATLPSPVEASLENRIAWLNGGLVAVLALALLFGDWYIAGRAALRMVRLRMESTAQLAAESMPLFLEAGQNLILQAAQPALLDLTPDEVPQALQQALRTVPFFRQMYLFDADGAGVTGYPEQELYALRLTPAEQSGVELALRGVPVQVFVVPADVDETSVQVSFIAAVLEDGVPQGALLGRTDFAINPFTQPILRSLQSLDDLGGVGMLADEQGYLLYHPDPSRLQGRLTLTPSRERLFSDAIALDGSRALMLQQPVIGQNWYVVLQVPAQSVTDLTVQIAWPLLFVLLLATGGIFLLLRLVLRSVTSSLRTLAIEAQLISTGNLEHALRVERADEVGQLGRAFEQMRRSLKARLEELNRLLESSRSMTSSLNMDQAVQPVLEAALGSGAVAARLVLDRAPLGEAKEETQRVFGMGEQAGDFAHLDEAVLKRLRRQERLILLTPERVQQALQVSPPWPAAAFAVALRHENRFHGALWVGFDRPELLTEETMRFLVTLAGQASLAVANTILFQRAEVERQRLSAILSSTPDPVLVTDQANRLMLANPSAGRLFAFDIRKAAGKPVERMVQHPALLALLGGEKTQTTMEIHMDDGRTFMAVVSQVQIAEQAHGQVCVLRDVSHFKELDRMKTEFVHTVSHDLRSPLTLMRGYASMLPMVGPLNEQQLTYVKKIMRGVENMARMVNNLLDLGRIEAGVGLKVEMVPLYDVLYQVADAHRPRAQQKAIELLVEVPPHTMPIIYADAELLRQALGNLVENAIKYTPQGGKVWLRVQPVPDGIRFEVQDTGIGIAAVDQERLFEKFYRVKSRASQKLEGTGLGLAIVKSIAERHGGRVGVESELGKGSTFYIELPVRPPEPEAG